MSGEKQVDPSKNASAPLGGGTRISLAQYYYDAGDRLGSVGERNTCDGSGGIPGE